MQIRTRRQQIQELEAEKTRLIQVQELLVDNILAVMESDTKYTGNRYKSYETGVQELSNKYAGTADWGVIQAGNIIDIRASYIAGRGLKISRVNPDDEKIDATPEYEFAQRFIDHNELDHELVQDLAREAEIEGKSLIKLFPVENSESEKVDIAVRWISWTTNKYKANTSKDDYRKLENVTYTPPAGGSPVTLKPTECIYKQFAGRLDILNDTMPRTAKCLTQIEDLDMALRDWRQINKLFAAPVPDFECDSPEKAEKVNLALSKMNWKIGKGFAHTGTFNYKQPSSEGQRALESEIITLMKLISGATGVPIHFLGAPELTTKYGAANEGLLELIAMSTAKEREIWKAAYQELLDKAMLMWNVTTKKTALRLGLIKIDIPIITAEEWERLTSTWLLLYNSDAITRKTLLNQVPGLDVEAELKALEENAEVVLEKFSKRTDDEDEEKDEGDEE